MALNNANETPFSIRAATPADAPILRTLIQDLADFLGKPNEPRLSTDRLVNDMKSDLFRALLAFADNGEPAGYALYYLPCLSTVGCILYLEDLYVVPKYRHHYLGHHFFRLLQKIGVENECRCIELTVSGPNEGARVFYSHLGFENMSSPKAGLHLWKIEGTPNIEYIVNTARKDSALNELELTVTRDGQPALGWNASIVAKDLLFNPPLAGDEVPASQVAMLLRRGRLGSVVARQDNKMVGVALFHQKAYSSWLGQFLVVDRLFVRKEFHRKGVGMALAAELAKIALSADYSKMVWTAKRGHEADDFFNKLNAYDMTAEEGWLLHRWYRAKWPTLREWPQLASASNGGGKK